MATRLQFLKSSGGPPTADACQDAISQAGYTWKRVDRYRDNIWDVVGTSDSAPTILANVREHVPKGITVALV